MQRAIPLHQRGQLGEAANLYQQVLSLNPGHAAANQLLGVIAHQQGNHGQAEQLIRKAIQLDPALVPAYNNLGVVLRARNKLEAAKDNYLKLLSLKPDYAEAHSNLGIILAELKQSGQAAEHLEKAVSLNPKLMDAWNTLGIVRRSEGRLQDAIQSFEKAIQLAPNFAEAHNNLGNAYVTAGQIDKAIGAFQQAIKFQPEYTDAHSNLGNAYEKQGLLDEAWSHFQRALKLNPADPACLFNCGLNLHERGHYEEADNYYQQAIAKNPDNLSFRSNAVMLLNYTDRLPQQEVFEQHCSWETAYKKTMAKPGLPPLKRKQTSHTHIRIGFVSADLREHSVYYFFEPLLKHLDPERFETFCYYNHHERDSKTGHIQSLAQHWRDVADLDDLDLGKQIRKDNIDILVDLSGHSAGHRLGTFCYRPAPVQATWLGYPNTSGLSTMDFRITDIIADPEGDQDQFYTEELIRVEGSFLCYQGNDALPFEQKLPADTSGYLTFGSFNNLTKVNAEVLSLWAKLLAAIPESRLILKSKQLASQSLRDDITKHFTQAGVDGSRIELHAKLANYEEHLRLYDRIDVGLDPFPYNGTTTTLEAMWMGVPTLTLVGNRHAGRVGASILTHMGLEDFNCTSGDSLIEQAKLFNSNRALLRDLRPTLRERMQASPLGQAENHAKHMASAFEQMLHKQGQ